MKKLILPLVVFLVVSFGSTAGAQITPERLTISGLFGGYLFEGGEDILDSPVYALRLGYDLNRNWGIEGAYDYVPTERKTGTRNYIDAFLYHLDALYYLTPDEKLVPYLAGGLGNIYRDPTAGHNNTDFGLNFGAGVKYFVTDRLAIRGDLRDYVFFNERTIIDNFEYTIGLTYVYGHYAHKAKAEAPPPAPKKMEMVGDDDHDGVSNDADKCPGTPPGTPVDANGCPKDSDGDGVINTVDECPDTPAGAPVDSKGCPKDSDGDGVPDYLDKCPDTLPGIKVDATGCPIEEEKISINLDIKFDTNKADIKPQYDAQLKKVADLMKTYPKTKAEIEGHTDSTGSLKYNNVLSQRRADSVMKYLVEKLGVDPSRLTAKGYGPSRPIADNATKEGRQQNRRVVATITANK